ncbi:urease accessory protein UreD [Neobacillus muris]|uniref:urease accessory protein UreD n=1 Tax=Neobacillus muris TaxID=2941334 RepID=UPI00204191A1|nr:urease accessory protein UreD [Neobacillus muris]
MKTKTGYLKLVSMQKRGKTILKDSYAEGAFKITRPVYLTESGEAYFYVMNPGGGYLDGDSYQLELILEERAEVFVTTQSSTKIYKTRACPASQEMVIDLAAGSVFEYLPDPVIAYQHARFKQRTLIRMEPDASLIIADIFTPGWAPDGRFFPYDWLQSKMEVYMDGRLVLFDHVKLEPDRGINSMGFMEGYSHFGTMAVIHEQLDRDFLEELVQWMEPLPDVRIGVSLLSVPGFSLRMLANSTQAIENVLFGCHEVIRKKLFQKEPVFLRKY